MEGTTCTKHINIYTKWKVRSNAISCNIFFLICEYYIIQIYCWINRRNCQNIQEFEIFLNMIKNSKIFKKLKKIFLTSIKIWYVKCIKYPYWTQILFSNIKNKTLFNLMVAKIGWNVIMTLFGIDFGGSGILKKQKYISELNSFDFSFIWYIFFKVFCMPYPPNWCWKYYSQC